MNSSQESRAWATSDWHLGQEKILRFKKDDGTLTRPGFDNIDQMTEILCARYKELVAPGDTVYFMGDMVFHEKELAAIGSLPGRKIFIPGNHDKLNASVYLKVFRDMRALHRRNDMLLTHMPVHTGQVGGGMGAINVHGHLHVGDRSRGHVLTSDGQVDQRYYNVNVELHDYRPVLLTDICRERSVVIEAWRKLRAAHKAAKQKRVGDDAEG